MKKIMLFAAACVALAACNKGIDTTTPEIGDAVSFEKGQQVCLTANAPAATKVTGSLNATTDAVDFKWETGDKIKVIVGESSAEFTLSSGAGTASATFTGTMPAGGNSFDVQYPVTDPDLSTQTYVENGLPKDKMKMTATGCTLDKPFSLTAQNAALRLNLYGLNREVSSIAVTNTTADPNVSYTLNCSTAVRVGNSVETATPFLLVIPAGASEWKFKVEVTAGNATANLDSVPTYTEGSYEGSGIVITTGTFSTSSAQTFTAAQILNMPAKLISTVWAPVNCGYDATDYPYGLLYQWGRKYGQGYNDDNYKDADYPGKEGGNQNLVNSHSPQTSHPDGSTYNGNFYHDSKCDIGNWYGGSDPDKLWNSNEGTSNPVSKSGYDPCPDGWRVPTSNELNALFGGNRSPAITAVAGQNGCYFNGSGSASSGVFLPAAGFRDFGSGSVNYRGSTGFYWSSSIRGDGVWYLAFISGYAGVDGDYRARGYSVRCVQE